MLRTIAALAGALGLAAPAPSAAQGAVPAAEASVTWHDLDASAQDVTAPDGARVLMDRIATAATLACGGGPESSAREHRLVFDRCRDAAFGRIVSRLDPAILAAVSDYRPPRRRMAAR